MLLTVTTVFTGGLLMVVRAGKNEMDIDFVVWTYLNWCFEPSQPLGIISGLKETFIKRYKVERTNKAEISPEEQSEKMQSCWENLWNEIQLKGP